MIKGGKRVKTNRLVCNIEPHFTMIPYPRRKEDITEGGIWTCRKNRKKVAEANVQFELEGRYYPLSGDIPAKSVVIANIDVAETARGKGYGSEVLKDIEREAKEQGMKRMYATSVLFPAEGFWKKQGFKHTGQRRVWLKKLE